MGASWAHGQGYAFGIDSTNQLYRVDLSNASSTLLGTPDGHGAIYECLGMDAGGTLYGATVFGDLFSINTTTAVSTYIGNTGLGNCEGMDWDASTGRMLLSDFSSTPSVYDVNLSTAAVQLVQTATSSGSVVRTLASRGSGSVLDVRYDVNQQGDLHGTFDLSTGTTSTIGAATQGILGMDYELNGTLYGLSASGDLVTIDPTTGVVGLVGTVNPSSYFLGMATDVVPEPVTLVGLSVALLAVLKKRR